MDKRKIIRIALFLLGSVFAGFCLYTVLFRMTDAFNGRWDEIISKETFIDWKMYVMGVVTIIGITTYMKYITEGGKKSHIMDGKKDVKDSPLENSRFLTSVERKKLFPTFTYSKASKMKVDGIPVRAYMEHGQLNISVMQGAHSLVIGATGSGKTTTFINPMIQIIGATATGSSMIMTDPKGELYSLHSKFLSDRGYDVKVLDLRDAYNSSRWNPLDSIWNMYHEYLAAGNNIMIHKDDCNKSDYDNLRFSYTRDEHEKEKEWYEYNGIAFDDIDKCIDYVSSKKQQIYDEMYEDLNDLISVIIPVESKEDPVWEKGARSIVMATLLAMLEDSENPELGMTREKFNFFNLNKIIANSDNEYEALKNYFKGRDKMSTAVTMSRQVLSSAEATMSSYMSIAFDKLNMFNDRGLCTLTSSTDINPDDFAKKPTALFLKIPDERDTRHGLAAVFILCIYKALIKIASNTEELTLPRNVYFILDEFGNMPKIGKFDKMITVGRSRKIWFNMVVQSYSQLDNVYGEKVSEIIKSNCGAKLFIGSNDIKTCKEFSELCGNITVKTNSLSAGTGNKADDVNISTQMQSRPLIYPSELQKLNNKESTGNAIIVTFGNYPLKTKYTPSYKCSLYSFGQLQSDDLNVNAFHADKIFYDIIERNRRVLGEE